MNMTFVITAILIIVAYRVIPKAFDGIFKEQRDKVQGIDLLVAAILLFGAGAVSVVLLVLFHDTVQVWIWPLLAISVAGLISAAMRAALGVQLTRSMGQLG
jgi:hypothetical protein